MKPSTLKPMDFFEIVEKYNQTSQEGFNHFPMEYFITQSNIVCFKQIESKTYRTAITIDESRNVLIGGQLLTIDQFISYLKSNYRGLELVESPDEQETEISVRKI